MDIPTDEFYFPSPALNHLVPSSPHLFHHAHSPFQNVPDIIDRQSRNRARFAQDSPSSSQVSVFGPHSSQSQRRSATPTINTHKNNKENFEQVVPNCSPFPNSQSSVKIHNTCAIVPDDEKPPTSKIETKRKNRTIIPKQSTQSQTLNFVNNDDIFD